MKINWHKTFKTPMIGVADDFANLKDYIMAGAPLDVYYKGGTYCFLCGWSNEPEYINKPYCYKEEKSGIEKIYIYDTFEDSLFFKFADGTTFYEFLTSEKPDGPEPTPEIILSKQ